MFHILTTVNLLLPHPVLSEIIKTPYYMAPLTSLANEIEKLQWGLILSNISMFFEDYLIKLFVKILLHFFAYFHWSGLEQ